MVKLVTEVEHNEEKDVDFNESNTLALQLHYHAQ